MKKCIIFILTFYVCTLSLSAQSIIIKSGKCSIQEADAFDESKLWITELKNEEVKVVVNVRGSEFFENFVIMTSPRVTNFSDQKKQISFNLAFYNQKGDLVACTSVSSNLDKGAENMQIGASMPTVSRSLISEITSYQATLYIFEGKKE
jgi:hypothetical protein